VSILGASTLPSLAPVERMRRSIPARPVSRPRRAASLFATALSALVASIALDSGAAEAGAKPTREYDLKAVFLFNFAQFVEWPSEAFPEASTPFVICVLGDDPFGKSLDEIVANEAVRNRRIVIRRYRDVQEISICHILYIGASEAPKLNHVLAALDGKHILTVGETDLFTTHNGIIQFRLVENKLRLRINIEAARMAKLSISSQLLRQAEIVDAK
jgi:hypothetical protein